ncbi:gag precursor polyprotein [Lymphoproliferative disease virus]|nr:gag precursor polyprotein [Lymphoproliferative disease virus]
MDTVKRVLKTLAQDQRTSVRSKDVVSCIERLIAEGAIKRPSDIFARDIWPQCTAMLTQKAMTGSAGELRTWGTIMRILQTAKEEKQAWKEARAALELPSSVASQTFAEAARLIDAAEAKNDISQEELDRNVAETGQPSQTDTADSGSDPPAALPVRPLRDSQDWRGELGAGESFTNSSESGVESSMETFREIPTAPPPPMTGPGQEPPPNYPWEELRAAFERMGTWGGQAARGHQDSLKNPPHVSEGSQQQQEMAAVKPKKEVSWGQPLKTSDVSMGDGSSDSGESGDDEDLLDWLPGKPIKKSGRKSCGRRKEGTLKAPEFEQEGEELIELLKRVKQEVERQSAAIQGSRQISRAIKVTPVPLTDWGLVATECKLGGLQLEIPLPRVAPVRQMAGGHIEWTPLDPKMVKQLKEAIQEEGTTGPLASVLLDQVHQIALTPSDLRQLARIVLTPVMAALWKSEWTERLQVRVTMATNDRRDPLHGVTMAVLKGSDPAMATPQLQAARMRGREIQASCQASREAYVAIGPLGKRTDPWTKVTQGLGEPFLSFAERLLNAIEKSQLPEAAKNAVFRDCVKQQGNMLTQQYMLGAPSTDNTAELVKYLLKRENEGTAQGNAAAIVAALKEARADAKCFKCGAVGHMRRDCPSLNKEAGGARCWSCGGAGHLARECRKRGRENARRGALVTAQGNGGAAVGRRGPAAQQFPHPREATATGSAPRSPWSSA